MRVKPVHPSEKTPFAVLLLGLGITSVLQIGAICWDAKGLALLLPAVSLVLAAAIARWLHKRVWHPLGSLLTKLAALNDYSAEGRGLPAIQAQIGLLEVRLREAIRFIGLIREGNQEEVSLQIAAHEQHDPLVVALVDLNTQLQHLAGKEKQRLWVSEGLARFVEILRGDHTQPEKLCEKILTTLVRYLEANQGVLLVKKEEAGEVYLEQAACYAYGRKKYTTQRFDPGQGLVGQCYREKETVLLTEIPADYVRITSGLGEALPNCILLVPLKRNDDMLGVVELAAFRPFGPTEVELVEKLAENIAATLSNLHTQQVTGRLLAASQEQAQQLAVQESVMRQNLEEMQATQEEMLRSQRQIQQQEELHRQKVEELIAVREELETQLRGQLVEMGRQQSRTDAFLKSSLDTITFLDAQGLIMQLSPGVEKMFGYKPAELTGKPVETLLPLKDQKFLDAYASGCGKDFGIPVEYTAKSKMYGFLFPVEVSLGKALVDGEMLYTATIRNIAKRKEYEENTRKSLKNLQELNDNLQRKDQELKELRTQLETRQA